MTMAALYLYFNPCPQPTAMPAMQVRRIASMEPAAVRARIEAQARELHTLLLLAEEEVEVAAHGAAALEAAAQRCVAFISRQQTHHQPSNPLRHHLTSIRMKLQRPRMLSRQQAHHQPSSPLMHQPASKEQISQL